jgi:single-stranded-DNA-specific exonuclease
MEKAVTRIRRAIANGELILIVGDYDVDGTTATTIMVRTLQSLGANVAWYIPSRFTDGYGLNVMIIERAISQGVSLIITVDNGIAAFDAATAAKERDIDLIITDHHQIGQAVPIAYAVVHPAYPRSLYPFPDLCGAGVAFKLAQALLERLPDEYLDLVALATVADQVPLLGENRILVKEGLAIINRDDHSLGIAALIEVAGLTDQRMTSTNLAFQIAPRINAVGRLANASQAVELFLTDDPHQAMELARVLNAYNHRRKSIQDHIEQQALAQIAQHPEWLDHRSLVVAGEEWHEGVIGIVAGKLTERFGKPTLCIATNGDKAKGSGRSVEEFDLYRTLADVQRESHVFTKWGGHAMAAGFSLASADVETLRQTMWQVIDGYEDVELKPQIRCDAPLTLTAMSYQLVNDLQRLEPFGQGNPEPVFLVKGAKVVGVQTMGEEKHLKVWISDNLHTYQVVAFGRGQERVDWERAGQRHLLVTVGENVWNGERALQMMLVDAR